MIKTENTDILRDGSTILISKTTSLYNIGAMECAKNLPVDPASFSSESCAFILDKENEHLYTKKIIHIYII